MNEDAERSPQPETPAVPNWALCYRFDIVLRGRNQTPTER